MRNHFHMAPISNNEYKKCVYYFLVNTVEVL